MQTERDARKKSHPRKLVAYVKRADKWYHGKQKARRALAADKMHPRRLIIYVRKVHPPLYTDNSVFLLSLFRHVRRRGEVARSPKCKMNGSR